MGAFIEMLFFYVYSIKKEIKGLGIYVDKTFLQDFCLRRSYGRIIKCIWILYNVIIIERIMAKWKRKLYMKN